MTIGLLTVSIALLASVLAIPGAASADPDAVAGAGAGLTAPAGIVRTPDGGLWVADEVRGVCRVALGAQPHLVDSPWCVAGPDQETEGPEPGDTDALGGAPVAAVDAAGTAIGPASVGGLAFDPQTDNFYVGDRDSSGGGVWRLHFDRATGVIDGGTQIAALADRVQTLTLGPDAAGTSRAVFFYTKRGGDILRISDPAGTPAAPELVAHVGPPAGAPDGAVETEGEVASLAATDDALYWADGGVKRLALTGGPAVPQPVAGFDGLTVEAVAIDAANGRLYAGTANPDLADYVHVVDLATGAHEPYEQGFTTVTALGVDADGTVLVADDPTLASQATVWQARLWSVPVQPLGRPQTRITEAPAAAISATDATFAYASRDGAAFECRLDDAAFAACPGTSAGRLTYRGLPEGAHRFSVRAKDGTTGLYASARFVVDRTAPTVTAIQPTADYIDGGLAPRIRFSAYEDGISYECSVDDGPFKPCYSGNPVENLTAGTHVLRVIGIDAAGNTSDPYAPGASVKITVLERWRPPVTQTPDTSTPADAGAPTPAAPATGAGPGATAAPAAPLAERGPILFPFTLRFKESPSSTRRLRFGLDAPGTSAQLRVTVKNWRNHTVLTRLMPVRAGAHNRLDLTLTRSEQRRLRPGRYLVTAVLRTARGTQGNPQTHWLRIRRATR